MPQAENTKNFQCYCGYKIPERLKESIRKSVCRNLPNYRVLEGKSYCVLHFPQKDKETDTETEFEKVLTKRVQSREFDFRGVWFPSDIIFTAQDFTEELDFSFAFFNGNTDFSWSHFENTVHFVGTFFNGIFQFNQGRLKDSDFSGSVFYDLVSFYANRFLGNCDFSHVTFKKTVEFCESQFYGYAIFDESVFEDTANFFHTDFHKNEFTPGSFRGTEFKSSTTFSHASFAAEADFSSAKFQDALDFDGNFGGFEMMSFQFATFEKPEKVLFFRISLHPNWFIHIDCRKFVFTDVYWKNLEKINKGVKSELAMLKEREVQSLDISNPYRLLTIACRQLAENAENSSRLEEASKFRQMALETEWFEKKRNFWNWIINLDLESEKLKRRFGGSEDIEDKANPPTDTFGVAKRFDFLHLLYRFTSYYGESWRWALVVLIGIWLIWVLIYTQSDFYVCSQPIPNNLGEIASYCRRSLFIGEAMKQSLGAMFLQKSEYRKPLEIAEAFVLIENVLAPIQATLLALTIRRRFMR